MFSYKKQNEHEYYREIINIDQSVKYILKIYMITMWVLIKLVKDASLKQNS